MRGTRRQVLAGAAAASWVATAGAAHGRTVRRDALRADGLWIHVARYAVAPPASIPVIYVHGATFPSSLAVGWRFGDEPSWSDNLVEAGYDVWGFDFAGYGKSQRYREMAVAAAPGPLGRSDSACRQLAAVVDHVRRESGSKRAVLLAHSWGTIVAARFAAERPALVERLVLFGPILRRSGGDTAGIDQLPGWSLVTTDEQVKRFREDVPPGEEQLITDDMFAPWGAAYLASDPGASARHPPAVAVPNGPVADILAARGGMLPYDPQRITCPVAIVRGAWDSRVTDKEVAAFRSELSACPSFTDAKLERGTHLMHLETGRTRLWAATRNALAESKQARIDTHAVIFEVKPAEAGRAEYLARAAALRPLLDEVEGFQTIERFQSSSREGWLLSLSTWSDDAAVAAWRSRGRHHEAQAKGRSGVFEDYRLRVAHARFDSAVGPERQPICPSAYRDPSRRPVAYVGLVEIDGTPATALDALLSPRFRGGRAEAFSSLTKPGRTAHLLDLASFKAAQRWQAAIERASRAGNDPSSNIRVRILEVLRDYGMFERAEAPQYHPPAKRPA